MDKESLDRDRTTYDGSVDLADNSLWKLNSVLTTSYYNTDLESSVINNKTISNNNTTNKKGEEFIEDINFNEPLSQTKSNGKSIKSVFKTIKNLTSNNDNIHEKELKILKYSSKDYKTRKIKSSFMGLYVGLLTSIGGFIYGYDTGVINGLLEMNYVKINFSKNKHDFNAEEIAILTAILSLGTLAGSLFSPLISDKLGRRFCIILALLIIFTIGVILQICASSFGLLLAGRFINGIGVGIISSVVPLYQAEISPKWIRGTVISFYQWAITWGLLVSSAISQGTRKINNPNCFRIPISLQFIWCGFMLVGLFSISESPRFYVMKNKLDDAILSLSRFRRLSINDSELIEELIEIKASYDYEISEGNSGYLDCFKNSPSRNRQLKRMLTGLTLQALQQCSGINFIFYYGVNFFAATHVNDSYLISFITYAVNVAFTIPGILLVDKLGRRKLLIFGSFGMIVSNFIIAIVGTSTMDSSVLVNKIMIAFVCLFIAFFASTWGPVVWILTGELFNLSIRQKAVSISASCNWIVNFVFAFFTPYLIDEGKHTAAIGTKIFFLWGSLNIVGLIVTYFFVYETKGLLLEDVDELYRICSIAYKSDECNEKIKKMNKVKEDSEIEQINDLENEMLSHHHHNNNNSEDDDFNNDDNLSNVSSNVLSPMDIINEWERKQKENKLKDQILSDEILKMNEIPPNLDDSNDENSSFNNEGTSNLNNLESTNQTDIELVDLPSNNDERITNTDSSEEYSESGNESFEGLNGDLALNYGIYGDENIHLGVNNSGVGGDSGNDEDYRRNVEDMMNFVNEQIIDPGDEMDISDEDPISMQNRSSSR